VVHLDDLDGLEVRGGQLGEPHHQQRADGEVRGDEDRDPGRGVEPPAYGRDPLLVEPRRADDRVDAVGDAVLEVGHHRVGMREVDRDLGTGRLEGAQVVSHVHLRDQLEPVRLLHAEADLGADLAASAQHTDPDLAHAVILAGWGHGEAADPSADQVGRRSDGPTAQ